MPRTIPSARSQRTNLFKPSSLDGGQPAHPMILHLEAHVEELFAIDDVAEFLARAAHTEDLVADAIAFVQRSYDAAVHLSRILTVSRRLTRELRERATRLHDVVLPSIRECYQAAEERFSGARA